MFVCTITAGSTTTTAYYDDDISQNRPIISTTSYHSTIIHVEVTFPLSSTFMPFASLTSYSTNVEVTSPLSSTSNCWYMCSSFDTSGSNHCPYGDFFGVCQKEDHETKERQ